MLGLSSGGQVLPSSTGVIGWRLPIEAMLKVRCIFGRGALEEALVPRVHNKFQNTEECSSTEILVLPGGAIPPAVPFPPSVPFCTRVSARLKRVGSTVHA